jgi:hypothetical protein
MHYVYRHGVCIYKGGDPRGFIQEQIDEATQRLRALGGEAPFEIFNAADCEDGDPDTAGQFVEVRVDVGWDISQSETTVEL